MAVSTITLQSRINFASTHADLLPLTGVGGYTNEPALSICSEAASEIINDENDWKWNSVELCAPIGLTQGTGQPLIVYQSKQDYYFAGASAFTMNISGNGTQSSGASIDLASNNAVTVTSGTVTVKTLEPHRFQVGNTVYLFGLTFTTGTASKYNATFTDDGSKTTWAGGVVITAITSTSFSFAAITGQANNDVGGAPGISNLGWLTAATMMELNNNSSPMNVRHLKAVRQLPAWSKLADPEQVAVVKDFGTGVIVLRFMYVPASVTWIVNLVYQQTPPLYTTLASTWGIPDRYLSLINQAVLYRMYRYIDSPKTDSEYKKLQIAINEAKGADQAEESSIFLEPMDSLVDIGPYGVGY